MQPRRGIPGRNSNVFLPQITNSDSLPDTHFTVEDGTTLRKRKLGLNEAIRQKPGIRQKQHAKLYSDLLQSSKRKTLIALGFH